MRKNLLISSLMLSTALTVAAQTTALPYSADWKYKDGGHSADANAGKPNSDHTQYDLGGWANYTTAGANQYYITISKGAPLANTLEFVDAKQEEQKTAYLVSPAFNFSANTIKNIVFKAGIQSATSRATNLDVLYTTNWTGDVTTTAWETIKSKVIPAEQAGLATGDMANIQLNLDIQAENVVLAIKADKDEAHLSPTEQTKLRMTAFSITETEKSEVVNIPYASDWKFAANTWNPADSTFKDGMESVMGKPDTDNVHYELGGWSNISISGDRAFYLAKSGSKALFNTVEFVDNKQQNPLTNWFVSPAFNFANPGMKYISMRAGKSTIDQLSSNLTLMYTTNYTGDVETTQWTVLHAEIIPEEQVGLAETAMHFIEEELELTANEVVFAIKGHRAENCRPGSKQAKLRFRNFIIGEKPFDTSIDGTTATENIVSIFPNPATEVINIQTTETVEKVEIINLMGSIVLQANGNVESLNVEAINAGSYIVRISLANGEIKTSQLIKK